MEKKQWKYRIGGGLHSLAPLLVLLVVFGSVSVWLRLNNNGAFLFTMLLTIIVLVLIACSIYRFLFSKIFLGEDGFYHQTKPGNGTYYAYTEITEAWESSEDNLRGTAGSYCSFRTADGQVVKFLFTPSEAEAIDYFLMRVNGEESGADGR